MKKLIFGDIHCRKIWKDIIRTENPDHVIFLGDYISTHEVITDEDEFINLLEILEYKENNSSMVTLLRGNHDLEPFHNEMDSYFCHPYSGGFSSQYLRESKDRFSKLTQWIYIDEKNKIIFSHAGISKIWMKYYEIESIFDINNLPLVCQEMGFTCGTDFFDNNGRSPYQPPTWIRPDTLYEVAIPEYTQVIGHTRLKDDNIKCIRCLNNEEMWLCDTLPNQYLTIENDDFIIKNI